jgi:hypothetical protein
LQEIRANLNFFMLGIAAGDFGAHDDVESEIFGVSESHNMLAAS